MSRKRKSFSSEFKTKVVLEVLKNESSLNEIAAKYKITPKNILNWKKKFLENAEIAMDPSVTVKEYKDKIKSKDEEIEMLHKTLGKTTVERDWLAKKLKSLDLKTKKALIEPKLKELSLSKQTNFLEINRTSMYYQARPKTKKQQIIDHINHIFEKIPIYGTKKVHCQLTQDGFDVSLNTVQKYRQELGLKALIAVKPVNTTVPAKEHKKYPYKLKGVDINRANQVWSTDITYIKTKAGSFYLAAIIDWYSKAVLSHRISNTMDTDLVMDVLNEAFFKYGKPEIFNTDQGSQYTSYIHTQALKNKNITISMDSKGRATDNIAIERFWRSAKCERIYLNEYNSIQKLKDDVDDYINFYNNQRFHQTLDYKKPMEVYKNNIKEQDQNYQKTDKKAA